MKEFPAKIWKKIAQFLKPIEGNWKLHTTGHRVSRPLPFNRDRTISIR